MVKKLEILIKMQHYDDIIGEKEQLKEELPKKLSSMKNDSEETAAAVADAKKALDENMANQKAKELEIKSNREKMDKYARQLNDIKDNKEYKALNSEIANLQQKNSAIDDEILAIMDNEAQLRKALKDAQSAHKEADNELKTKESDLQKQIENVQHSIDYLRDKRNELARTLPASIVKRYGQMIKSKDRKAVVFSDNSSCSGCGFNMRPQMQIEITKQAKLLSCENCGRFITVRPADDFYKDL